MNLSVHIEKLGPVTVVTLDRPEVRNAVNADTARTLYQASIDFDADDQALVAVFHGAHEYFCAGWDLQAAAQMAGGGNSVGPGVLVDLDFEPVQPPPADTAGFSVELACSAHRTGAGCYQKRSIQLRTIGRGCPTSSMAT